MPSDDDHKDYHEGPEAARRAEQTMARILTVSKDELTKREAAYKKSRRHSKKSRSR
jgi:hypothetical protein